ncbi:hypothetical protein [Magnetospirillum fulvum]|uniref:PEGA domain-containing protein n=1 Tax=Magnetospirillum fulvum TaxID=1082 RepID=A0A1H6HW68_MAGFU|nr:hypothetical protein [Magnetospirillum fulvum]SEH38437.1 hypothetical protein SAMN04244559_02062 [Magnetospirillum fulvum]
MASLLVSSCASVVNGPSSDVRIGTRPESARCVLSGQGGFSQSVQSPATVSVPRDAAPVTVACTAPGYRRTVATLTATADGWVWGNSALMVVTGGVALLGLAVDEAVGSVWEYDPDFTLPLDEEKRRPLTVRERGTATELKLGE